MTLIRWEPLREIDSLQREMNRLFENLAVTRGDGLGSTDFVPAAELRETGDTIDLRIELPGVEAKDIDVQVTADSVSILGERRGEALEESEGVLRSEFHYGSFQRVIPLPSRVKNTHVEAEYRQGILRLRLPKEDAEKNRVVKVEIRS
ncbi:Hsp20/alpha crystallin family protein [Geitlerinema sp. PCC 7407]|uniref:Hsp20/alpha crystallin family protein n=1 Tax=Geitlerinema sp. PCC 7407 TaxID=1173025 RepID=UPI00029F832F|nr:Hsp20/alpha crystallin family protein [Geitlerinema sp. PCC 7407]AFY68110.1 heat shock protein Hsp20 [Geitlerinema sp. PCC 7407]